MIVEGLTEKTIPQYSKQKNSLKVPNNANLAIIKILRKQCRFQTKIGSWDNLGTFLTLSIAISI